MVQVFFLLAGILTVYVTGESWFSTKLHHVDVYGEVFFLLSGILTVYITGESMFSTKLHHVDVYVAGLLPLIRHPDRVRYRREFVLN